VGWLLVGCYSARTLRLIAAVARLRSTPIESASMTRPVLLTAVLVFPAVGVLLVDDEHGVPLCRDAAAFSPSSNRASTKCEVGVSWATNLPPRYSPVFSITRSLVMLTEPALTTSG
jgi:hypothetical protein